MTVDELKWELRRAKKSWELCEKSYELRELTMGGTRDELISRLQANARRRLSISRNDNDNNHMIDGWDNPNANDAMHPNNTTHSNKNKKSKRKYRNSISSDDDDGDSDGMVDTDDMEYVEDEKEDSDIEVSEEEEVMTEESNHQKSNNNDNNNDEKKKKNYHTIRKYISNESNSCCTSTNKASVCKRRRVVMNDQEDEDDEEEEDDHCENKSLENVLTIKKNSNYDINTCHNDNNNKNNHDNNLHDSSQVIHEMRTSPSQSNLPITNIASDAEIELTDDSSDNSCTDNDEDVNTGTLPGENTPFSSITAVTNTWKDVMNADNNFLMNNIEVFKQSNSCQLSVMNTSKNNIDLDDSDSLMKENTEEEEPEVSIQPQHQPQYMQTILKRIFGFPDFREGQKYEITNIKSYCMLYK